MIVIDWVGWTAVLQGEELLSSEQNRRAEQDEESAIPNLKANNDNNQ